MEHLYDQNLAERMAGFLKMMDEEKEKMARMIYGQSCETFKNLFPSWDDLPESHQQIFLMQAGAAARISSY